MREHKEVSSRATPSKSAPGVSSMCVCIANRSLAISDAARPERRNCASLLRGRLLVFGVADDQRRQIARRYAPKIPAIATPAAADAASDFAWLDE
jgi:hypothetical protein